MCRAVSVVWRVPAGQNPVAAYFKRVGVITEVQRLDGCPSHGCQTDDAQSVFAPAEMIRPRLCARVKQRNSGTRFRVCPCGLVALVTVTNGAGQPQIRFIVCAALSKRDNVLNFQPSHHQVLRTQAIPTTVTCSGTHTSFDSGGDTFRFHDSRVVSTRVAPQPLALALCAPSHAGRSSSTYLTGPVLDHPANLPDSRTAGS